MACLNGLTGSYGEEIRKEQGRKVSDCSEVRAIEHSMLFKH